MCTAIALAGAGDTVALTNPFYFNYDTTLSMLGIGRRLVDCDPAGGFLPDLAFGRGGPCGRREDACRRDTQQSHRGRVSTEPAASSFSFSAGNMAPG